VSRFVGSLTEEETAIYTNGTTQVQPGSRESRAESARPSRASSSATQDDLRDAVRAITSRLDAGSSAVAPRGGGRRPFKFESLVTRGFLTRDQLAATAVEAREQQASVESLLILKYDIPKPDIGLALSLFYRCPFVQVDRRTIISPDLLKNLSADRVRRGRWVPLSREGDTLSVLLCDPYDLPEVDAIGHLFAGHKIKLVVGISDDVVRLIDETFQAGPATTTRLLFEDVGSEGKDAEPDDVDSSTDGGIGDSDGTVIRLANHLIEEAHRERASDIHIEPCSLSKQTVIRFRVDGVCLEYQRVPLSIARPLVARFKIMASLDIAERRKPQDGKIHVRLPDGELELRLSTIPTIRGNEDLVMRLLAPQDLIPLEEHGLNERNFQELSRLIVAPHGMLLCVGPTGSGKTTTLHALLKVINTQERKIWTAEDPVELTQMGLRQVQVRTKIGLTFASIMRAFLRGDPDVIMVGEIRDTETALIAVEASLTGHLVLSTLHTNSAAETIVRLLDLGVEPFNFSDALLGVLAQRLVRRLCLDCREPYRPTAQERERLMGAYGIEEAAEIGMAWDADAPLYRGRGCASCRGTGYRGRLAIHELLVASDTIKDMIYRRDRITDVLRDAKKGGMTTLVQDGVRKILAGLTDLSAVALVASR